MVFNAVDGTDDETRRAHLGHELELLRSAGLQPTELDLREYFGLHDGQQAIVSRLEGMGLVWVRGGNTFVLRRAAAASGFDRAVSDLLGRDALVYGGYSAGVCMLAPTLSGIELCDDLRRPSRRGRHRPGGGGHTSAPRRAPLTGRSRWLGGITLGPSTDSPRGRWVVVALHGESTFTPVEAKTTHVEHVEQLSFRGPARPLMERMLGTWLAAETPAEVARMKALLEG